MYEIPLEEGDVVILATDGLFDNLWDEQLLELVDEALQVGCVLVFTQWVGVFSNCVCILQVGVYTLSGRVV